MKFFRCLSVYALILLVAGCAAFSEYGKYERSARKAYGQGAFDKAVFDCAKSLRLKPDYGKAQQLIQTAFRAAVNQHKMRIREKEKLPDKFKWDEIVRHYEALIRLNEVVMGLPPLIDKKTKKEIRFQTEDYTDEINKARYKAAEVHYQFGLELMKDPEIDMQKKAAKEFKKALAFVSDYKNAKKYYEQCRQKAIRRMAIIPFENVSGKEQYGAIGLMITDEIQSQIMNNSAATEFLEIISRSDIERVLEEQRLAMSGLVDEKTAAKIGNLLGVHDILMGQITQIVYTPERTTSRKERQKSTVSVKVGKNQYVNREVYATVTYYKKHSRATVEGSFRIVEVATGKLRMLRAFSGEYEFLSQWATFVGDERALDSDAKRLIKRFEEPAPVEGEMVNRAARVLSRQLATALIDYAR